MGMYDESWCNTCGVTVPYNSYACEDCEGMYPEDPIRPDVAWAKYTFICDPDECDALLEFTARDGFGFPSGSVNNMKCPCGRMMTYISYEPVYAPIITDVSKVTPTKLVKINTNPYN